jgi:hypothetical protein
VIERKKERWKRERPKEIFKNERQKEKQGK